MPVLSVFYVRLRKLIGVIIHYAHVATGPCGGGGRGEAWWVARVLRRV